MKLVINKVQYVSLASCKAQLLENLWDRERPASRFGQMVVFLEKSQIYRETSSELDFEKYLRSEVKSCLARSIPDKGIEGIEKLSLQATEFDI